MNYRYIKNWSRVSRFGKSYLKIGNGSNPYKSSELQYHLINSVVKYYKDYLSCLDSKLSQDRLLVYLGDVFPEEGLINSWDGWYLVRWALWEALSTRSVVLQNDEIKLDFALYSETGLEELKKENSHWAYGITKSRHPDWFKKKLASILKIKNEIDKDFNVLKLEYVGSHTNGSLMLQNLSQKNIEAMSEITIPLGSNPPARWANMGEQYGDRGLFHHIGDETAFLTSALDVAETCVLVCGNEIGELTVLSVYGKNVFNIKSGDIIPRSCFKYIYGVTRGESFIPTKYSPEFNYTRKSWSEDNLDLCEQWFKTKTFQKLAGREIQIYTYQEFVDNIVDKLMICMSDNNGFMDYILDVKKEDKINEDYFLEIVNSKIVVEMNEKIKNISLFFKTIQQKVGCWVINQKYNGGLIAKMGDGNGSINISAFSILKYICENNDNVKWKNKDDLKLKIIEYVENIMSDYIQHGLISFWKKTKEKVFIVSDLLDIKYEYRIFVIDGKIATGSPCMRSQTPWDVDEKRKTRMSPRLSKNHRDYNFVDNKESRLIVAKYARFAKKFIKELRLENKEFKSFVLDVGFVKGEHGDVVVPIEVNDIGWSGAYEIDFRRVCFYVKNKNKYFDTKQFPLFNKYKFFLKNEKN